MTSLAALLIAGCSQNEVTEVSPDAHPQMKFGVYTGTSTRGVDTDNNSIKEDPDDASKYGGFGIMGYFTGSAEWKDAKASTAPSFMHNQKVKWDETNSAWTYTPIKYWPNNPNGKISFFAYAPYENQWSTGGKSGVIVSDANKKGIPSIQFKIKEGKDLPKMVDLVVANQLDKNYANSQNGVTFEFEHTLSRVSFKAKLGEGQFDGMDGKESFVYITEMWIVGSDHSEDGSNLSLINSAADANADSKFYTTATWRELRWNYGITGDNPDAIISKADFDLKSMLNVDEGITESNPTEGHSTSVTGVKIDKDSQGTGKDDNSNAVSLFPENQYLYLIPVGETEESQTIGCAAGDVKIGFHYDIVTKDQTHTNQFIASHAESVITIPKGHLQRKTTYQYTLVINLHEIVIENATVKPWGTETTESPVL